MTWLPDLEKFCICVLSETWCESVTFLLVFLWGGGGKSLAHPSVTRENLISM